jgi:hypothetical protein
MGSDSNFNFHREGEFNEGDMFPILYTIYDKNISGVLVVQSEDFEKKMVIRDRKIVFAASNRKLDSFGNYLLGNSLITGDIYRAADQYMSENKIRFGRALIELGYFTYDQVWTWVPNHLQSIVFSFFNVKSGTYRLIEEHREDMDTENILLDMDILAVIVEGMRRFKSGIVVEKRFESIEDLYTCNTNTHLLHRLDLKPYEIHVLTLVRQESKLEAILGRSELLEFDTLRLLYLFLVLEIVSSQKNAGIKKQTGTPTQIQKPGTLPESDIIDMEEPPAPAEPSAPAAMPRLSTFNSFEEALKYYNMKYEVIYKVMLKEIGPISLSLLLKAIGDIKDNLPPYFQKIQLDPDGTINRELLLKALWYHDFDQHIGDLLRALEEVLYTEINTVKKHLGVEYEQQVLKWIKGIGN